MKELYYKDENNYYKFEEVPENYFEENYELKKINKILYENLEFKENQIRKSNNIIEELEKMVINIFQ